MLISRGSSLLNIGLKCIKPESMPRNVQLQTVRHSWYYRAYQAKPDKVGLFLTDIVTSLTWWWVLWHVYHDYLMIIGDHPYPDVSAWTDEELGIPPDDED